MIVLRALWMKTTRYAILSEWKFVIRFKELRNTHQGYHKVASEMDWTISNEDILHFDTYVLYIDTKGTRSGIMRFMLYLLKMYHQDNKILYLWQKEPRPPSEYKF